MYVQRASMLYMLLSLIDLVGTRRSGGKLNLKSCTCLLGMSCWLLLTPASASLAVIHRRKKNKKHLALPRSSFSFFFLYLRCCCCCGGVVVSRSRQDRQRRPLFSSAGRLGFTGLWRLPRSWRLGFPRDKSRRDSTTWKREKGGPWNSTLVASTRVLILYQRTDWMLLLNFKKKKEKRAEK